jgi:cobalt-zinc-cadmium efflux system membrane fusion protein
MNKLIITLLIGLPVFFGCSSHEHEPGIAEQDVATVAVTQWTDKMEIFMEYETAVVGEEIKFIIHLTTVTDFQPVRAGKVILTFKQPNGPDISIEKNEILREGIFTPTLTFKTPGDYDFNLQYQGPNTTESFSIGKFRVYPSFDDIPAGKDEAAGEEITFLKEQQWKIDFATEKVQNRLVKSAVQAVGEVRPRPASYAEIVSPVEGIISIAAAKDLVKPGQKVVKGETMAVLVPPMATQNSWAEIYLEYEQAKSEYERAKRLIERNAVSEREFEQTQRKYEMHKAGFSNYFDTDEGSIRFDSKSQKFLITAPINGIVSDASILPGQKVDRHQKIFSIVDPSVVWLRIELYAEQAAKLIDISGASINIPGNNNSINLDKSQFMVVSRGEIIDPVKRTVTLWLEANNRNRQFLIGQTFSAQIYTSPTQEMLTVPISAVYDDNSQKIIFVHTSGESFEKRELVTGPLYNNYIGIISGVKSGERVVNRGGYQVKLASTSEEIGHPHTH